MHGRRDRQGREGRLARTVSVGAVLETLHGVEVADPFRWLEETDAPEVKAWTAEQNAATRAALDIPLR